MKRRVFSITLMNTGARGLSGGNSVRFIVPEFENIAVEMTRPRAESCQLFQALTAPRVRDTHQYFGRFRGEPAGRNQAEEHGFVKVPIGERDLFKEARQP